MTENLNAKHDKRHRLGNSVSRPSGTHEVSVVRCDACQRLATEHECRVYGFCPRCRNHRFRGAYPTDLEMWRIQFLNIAQRWEIHGERGWGWERAKTKARSL